MAVDGTPVGRGHPRTEAGRIRQREGTRRGMARDPRRALLPALTTREVVERAQEQREAYRLLTEWGGWWEPDERRLGAGRQPVPPPVHRRATDQCEQQQPDGSWVPAGNGCAVCTARARQARGAAARERAAVLWAARQAQVQAERASREPAAPAICPGTVAYYRCPGCLRVAALPAPLPPPGQYDVQCYGCRTITTLRVEA